MHILLTNDDGIFAPGLAAMYKELKNMGQVTVVAPSSVRSGTSHSVTFYHPITCCKVNADDLFTGYSVDGSPADCVKLAILQIMDKPADLIVSGINSGANAGRNISYSGTVAAALEGGFMEIPSVAVSMYADPQMNFDKAAQYACKTIKQLMPIKQGDVVNINIPSLAENEPRGVRVVPQATSGFDEYYVIQPTDNPESKPAFQLTGGTHRIDEDLTDTMALTEGFITVTSLITDMTNHEKNKELKKQLEID